MRRSLVDCVAGSSEMRTLTAWSWMRLRNSGEADCESIGETLTRTVIRYELVHMAYRAIVWCEG